ncbi:AI-2E family transporter [uncultured Hymenobacter sp.]|uniref:AI-2E family transporter n=1 Tax=uncultured Hymenobacter sp. TaxID=170016 RepID=UPI0035CBE1D0
MQPTSLTPEPEENIFSPPQRHLLLICSLLVLAALILFGLLQYLTSFLGAGILYVVLRPIFTALVHRRGWNRTLVTVLLILLSLVVLIVPFYMLTTLLIGRLANLSRNTDQILAVVHRLEDLTKFKITDPQNTRQLLQQGATRVSGWLPSLASGLIQFIAIVGLMLFTLYFMFSQQEAFLRGLHRYLPFREKTQEELSESLKNNVNANVLGQGLLTIIQGALTGLTLWIFQVPDPLFWGLVAVFVAFIPVLGTPLVWGPAALYQFAQGHPGLGAGILIVGVVVIINVDNVLRIYLGKKMGDIHPWITLVGIIGGVEVFGIVGLAIGPLLLSYFIVLMRVFERENRVLAKHVPTTTPSVEKLTEGVGARS